MAAIDTLQTDIIAARAHLAALEDQWRKAHVGYMLVDSPPPTYRRVFLQWADHDNGSCWNERSEEYDGVDALARVASDVAEADTETVKHVRIERISPLLPDEQIGFANAHAAAQEVVAARRAARRAFEEAMTKVAGIISQRAKAEEFIAQWRSDLTGDAVAKITAEQVERAAAIERLVDSLRTMARADHEQILTRRSSEMTHLEREEDALLDHPICECGLIMVTPSRKCCALADVIDGIRPQET